MVEGNDRVLVGKQIGAYKITALLGAGGMGEVYQAEDTRLGRTVAVKVLPTELARDNERLHRFIREARAASALNHANVAHIYEIGQSDGVHFIAMEYVEGQSLAQKMRGQPLDLGKSWISAFKPLTPWRKHTGKESLIVTSSPPT